jgi:DNA-binding transcriptional LysR family regulator
MLLRDLYVVLKVAEFRSITAAATSLSMQTATASAAVKRVESQLGVELFIRTTRQLRLSGAGERYLPECERALHLLDRAKQTMKEDLDTIDGELRIAVSSDLGRNLAMFWIDQLAEEHPNLRLKMHLSDSNIDFYRDSVDVALRYGKPEDSNLYGFKICDVPRTLCASPLYLEQYGYPDHPADLQSHNGLFYELNGVTHDNWLFTKGDEKFKIKMKGNRASNDGDVVRRWCVSGKGLATKSCLDVAHDLRSGRLKRVMPLFEAQDTELWLICPSRQSIVPAIRLLRDSLRQKTIELLGTLP